MLDVNQKILDLIEKASDQCCNLSCAASEDNLTDAHRQAAELSGTVGKIRTMLWEQVQKRKEREEMWP